MRFLLTLLLLVSSLLLSNNIDRSLALSSALNYLETAKSIQKHASMTQSGKRDHTRELEQTETAKRLKKLEEKIEQEKNQTQRDTERMKKELAQLKKEKRERELSQRTSVKIKPEEREKELATREIAKKIEGLTGTSQETASSLLLKPFVRAGVEAGYKKYGELKPEIKQAQKIAGSLFQAGQEATRSVTGKKVEPLSLSGKLTEIETNTVAKLSRKATCFANPLTYSPTSTAPGTTPVGFSFYNKSTRPVNITLKNNKLKKKQISAKIPAGYMFDLPLQISAQTSLLVTDQNKKIEYKFPKNKTVYVSWGIPEAEKSSRTIPYLYPQSGPAGGLLKTTEHCYVLSKNNKETNISPKDLEPKAPKSPKKAQKAKAKTKSKALKRSTSSSKQLVPA